MASLRGIVFLLKWRLFKRNTSIILTVLIAVIVLVLYLCLSKKEIVFFENYRDYYYKPWQQVTPLAPPAQIPMILHQTWQTRRIRSEYADWIPKWKKIQPNLEHWFWTDDTMRLFIKKKYPAYLNLYDSYPRNIQRVDVFRYFVLHEYGGIYADLDIEPMKNMTGILKVSPCILVAEPYENSHILHPDFVSRLGATITNAFMACRPKHPFMKLLMDNLDAYKGFWKSDVKNVIKTTGPGLVGNILEEYVKSSYSKPSASDAILIFPPEYFMPLPDQSEEDKVMELCRTGVCAVPRCVYVKYLPSIGKPICRELLDGRRTYARDKKTLEKAFTIHHFGHTWVGRMGSLSKFEEGDISVDSIADVFFPEALL